MLDTARLGASLEQFVGHPAYGLPQLHGDLERFVFLLGGSDGESLVGPPAAMTHRVPGQPSLSRALLASTSFALALPRSGRCTLTRPQHRRSLAPIRGNPVRRDSRRARVGMRASALASIAITTVLALALLLTATACGTSTRACGGQCGPPFQLQVTFRPGTAKQAAVMVMRKCHADPLVIGAGQPYRSHSPGTPGQWTAIIYTTKLPIGTRHIPLLTCLHRSPAVTSASWPD